MSLNLFPARVAIGRFMDKDQKSIDVYCTPEFFRAMSDLFARVGGANGVGLDDLALLSLLSDVPTVAPQDFGSFEPNMSAQHDAQLSVMTRALADIQMLSASVSSLSAEVQRLRESAGNIEMTIGYRDPFRVDWERPGKIGSLTPNTGAFTTISASGQITSTLASGTAPLVVASTTKVANLNADLLDGTDWTAPGTIGGVTPGSASFTTINASGQITSTLATGTAPLVIASTTQVSNLNVSQLVGATWVAPGTIGSTTRNTGAFTTLFVNVGTADEAGSQSAFVNTNSTEYSLPTIWAGHSTQKDLSLYNGATTGASGAASVLFVNTRNSGTSRSINAAGTINASGTDYAEYMTKADDCGDVLKGQIVGITADGKVTDKWAGAISFAIKSTNPSYVGGDTWGTADAIGERPIFSPQDEGETDAEYLAREDAFLIDLVSYESDLESARRMVDRIAFSGRVPCNVLGATPGHYIVPVQDSSGIKGVVIAEPTLQEYMRAVGRVIAIESDGRAQVVVKIG